MCNTFWSMSFFFFQAEDGIRDYKVTGVQTCALPILGFCCQRAIRVPEGSSNTANHPWPGTSLFGAMIFPPAFLTLSWYSSRSEERRVGKECRSRWSPYH